MAVDESKKDEYTKKFAFHGLYLSLSGSGRSALWHLINTAKTWGLTTGFDVDLDRVLRQLDEGRPLAQVDVTFHAEPVVRSTNGATMTGGPFCVMCGEPATLFCPNMVKKAQLLGLRLFFPADDARLGPARLHPGRCRKRLNDLIHAALVRQDAATNK